MIHKSDELNELFTRGLKYKKSREKVLNLVVYKDNAVILNNNSNDLIDSMNEIFKFCNCDTTKPISVANSICFRTSYQNYYFDGMPQDVMNELNKIVPPVKQKTLHQLAKIAYTKLVKLREYGLVPYEPVTDRSEYLRSGNFDLARHEDRNHEIVNFMFDNLSKCFPSKSLIHTRLTYHMNKVFNYKKKSIKDDIPVEFFLARKILTHNDYNKYFGRKRVVGCIKRFSNLAQHEFVTDDMIIDVYNSVKVGCIMNR